MAAADPVNILIVDDRPENLTALTGVLEEPGYRLVTAASANDALRWILRERFAVVLLDVFMPVMDGIELATLIKSRERSRDLPIIFLTASETDLDRVLHAYSLGAVDYLVRPVRPEVVRAKVAVFADLYRKTEQLRRQAELLHEHSLRERDREIAELRQQQERRYRDLADSLPQIVWRAAADGSVKYFTDRWVEYTGIPSEQSLEWGWLAAVHPDDRAGFQGAWLSSTRTGTTFQAECRLLRASGSSAWHLCHALPERGPSSEITGWLGAYTDIDAQKRAEEEREELLRRAQVARARAEEIQRRIAIVAEVSRLLSESLDLSTSLDKVARHLVDARSRGCVIEIRDEEGKPVKLAVAHESPADEARIRHEYSRRRAAQEPDTLVTPIETRRGTAGAITLLGTTSAGGWDPEEREFVSDIGRRIGFFVENASLYEQARRAVEARDEFLSIAAHELRTPLTAMMLHIQALGRGFRRKGPQGVSPETAITKIEAAERQLNRLAQLIEALLDVSRIASRRLKLDRQKVELGRVARDVAARFAEAAARDGGAIDVEVESPAVGLWDPARVEQILTNLVANAVKYGPGKPVTILVRRSGSSAELVVRDQGIGIAPESLERIFDRFERAVPAVSYGGLGLGLYITRQLVAAHGGTISVKSELGKGTELVVRLPIPEEISGSGAELLDDAEELADLDGFAQHA